MKPGQKQARMPAGKAERTGTFPGDAKRDISGRIVTQILDIYLASSV